MTLRFAFASALLVSCGVSPEAGDPTPDPHLTLGGELRVIEALGSPHRLVALDTGERHVRLRFAGNDGDSLRSGQHVQVSGVMVGDEFAVDSVIVARAAEGGSCTVTGDQKVAVILVDFPGNSVGVTTDFAKDVFFGADDPSLDRYWRETSYGKTSASGVAVGPYLLDRAYGCHEIFGVEAAALAAADADIDFAQFDRVVVWMPAQQCYWAGQAEMGCSSHASVGDGNFVASMSWMSASYLNQRDRAVQLAAHELGHNLGLWHSSSIAYPGETLGDLGQPGTISEYGDPFSAMALALGHYAAPQKQAVGWLDQGQVVETSTDGMFALTPMEQPGGVKALRVRRGASDEWLWVEYRRSIGGYDPTLHPGAFFGVLVHYEDPQQLSHTQLVDFAPATAHFLDAALPFGSSWTDPYSGLTLSVVENGQTAEVTVGYGAPSCVRQHPTVTIAPITDEIDNGEIAEFTATITSNDSPRCAPATYELTAVGPLTWANTMSDASVTVAPGASVTSTLRLASPTATEAGTYDASAAAVNRVTGRFDVSETLPVTVTSDCILAPPTAVMSPATAHIPQLDVGELTVTIENHDSAACGDTVYRVGSPTPHDWGGYVVPDEIAIPSGGTAQVRVGKVPPDTTTVGATYSTMTIVQSNGSPATRRPLFAEAFADIVVDPPCERRPLTVTLSPPAASLPAGLTGHLTMTLVSRDSNTCRRARYAVGAVAPDGWTSGVSEPVVFLDPGETHSLTVYATPPIDAAGTTGTVTAYAQSATGVFQAQSTLTVTPGCTRANPTVTLSPDPITVRAGTTASYTMTVVNNDSAACASSTFDLASSTPNGWATTLSATQLSLAPGQSGSATLGKTPPAMTTPGSYAVTASASSATGSGQGTAQCNVTAALVSTATAPGGPFTKGTTVSLNDTNWFGGSPQSGVQVMFTLTTPNGGTQTFNTTSAVNGVAIWKYKANTRGTYSFTARATFSGQTVITNAATFIVN